MQDYKIETSKIKQKKTHFPQIVEDCVPDCQRLSSARTRTRNSFSSFNPPPPCEQNHRHPNFVEGDLRLLRLSLCPINVNIFILGTAILAIFIEISGCLGQSQ